MLCANNKHSNYCPDGKWCIWLFRHNYMKPICKFYTLTDQIWFHPGNPPFVILRNMTWQVLWVKQELSTLPEHLSSHTVFVGYVLLDVLFLYFFSFGHCVSVLLRFTNSDYPLWYLQSLLSKYILSYSWFFFFSCKKIQLAFIFFFQIGNTEEGERFCRFLQNMEGL